MQRIAQIVQIKEKDIPEYERIHADVWPGVLATIESCNIRNYSIYRYNNLLFAYMEYHGADYEADMEKIAWPCWIATTRRVVKLPPSRMRSTS